jgi:hypothetical protein
MLKYVRVADRIYRILNNDAMLKYVRVADRIYRILNNDAMLKYVRVADRILKTCVIYQIKYNYTLKKD